MVKSFSRGLATVLGEASNKSSEQRQVDKTTEIKKEVKEIRATFILPEEYVTSIKALAYLDRLQIKDTITQIITTYLEIRKDDLKTALELYNKRKLVHKI